jgi:hypothetical protein
MNDKPLGRLERVELRNVWLSEATSFTPWLARPDNMAVLAETLSTSNLKLKKRRLVRFALTFFAKT